MGFDLAKFISVFKAVIWTPTPSSHTVFLKHLGFFYVKKKYLKTICSLKLLVTTVDIILYSMSFLIITFS